MILLAEVFALCLPLGTHLGGAGEEGRCPSDMLTLFEYLAVIVSVVIGLGLTRILEGVGRLLEARAQVRLY